VNVVVLLGDPVQQARLPELMDPWRDVAQLVSLQVASTDLHSVVAALRWSPSVAGFVFTVPHKIAAAEFADRLSPRAQRAGCINVLRRDPDRTWFGDTFDGLGFIEGLRAGGHTVDGASVAVVGGGGAGTVIAAALVDAGACRVQVSEVNAERRQTLARRFAGTAVVVTESTDPSDVDLLVNATPLGLRPADPLPVVLDGSGLPAAAVVADIIMTPAVTRLLADAKRLGYRTHPGVHMLSHQVDLIVDFFADVPVRRGSSGADVEPAVAETENRRDLLRRFEECRRNRL